MALNTENFIRLAGVEPATSGTEGQRSIQLSYKRYSTENDSTTNYTKSHRQFRC